MMSNKEKIAELDKRVGVLFKLQNNQLDIISEMIDELKQLKIEEAKSEVFPLYPNRSNYDREIWIAGYDGPVLAGNHTASNELIMAASKVGATFYNREAAQLNIDKATESAIELEKRHAETYGVFKDAAEKERIKQ